MKKAPRKPAVAPSSGAAARDRQAAGYHRRRPKGGPGGAPGGTSRSARHAPEPMYLHYRGPEPKIDIKVVGRIDDLVNKIRQDGGFIHKESVDEVSTTIAAREDPYGSFQTQCVIIDGMMAAMMQSKNWGLLKPDQREALHMTVVKISRVLNGDPNLKDSWLDQAGYAMLIANRL